ncbi:MAG: hypothetical protein ACTSWY_11905 [Promethearchaeota archaeon]
MNLTGKKAKKIHIYINPLWKNTLYKLANKIFHNKAFEIKLLMKEVSANTELKRYINKITKEAKILMKNPKIYRISMLESKEQKESIIDFYEYIKKRYNGAEINIYLAEDKSIYDPEKRMGKARPMKPAILIE